MEYTNTEKVILARMRRTDFKNLSKNDVLSFASELRQLPSDVSKNIIAQYPEFAKLMKSTFEEYKSIIDSLIESDTASSNEVYSIINSGMDGASDSREQFNSLLKAVQADYSMCLENPNLPPDVMLEILSRENELIKMAYENDEKIRASEKELVDVACRKDSEKRAFNWRLVGGISFALVTFMGISAGLLGGKFDIKLPKKD